MLETPDVTNTRSEREYRATYKRVRLNNGWYVEKWKCDRQPMCLVTANRVIRNDVYDKNGRYQGSSFKGDSEVHQVDGDTEHHYHKECLPG